jgi:hypothetical protein
MYSGGTLIERWWRQVIDAKRRGNHAAIDAIADLVVGPSVRRGPVAGEKQHTPLGGLLGVLSRAVDNLANLSQLVADNLFDGTRVEGRYMPPSAPPDVEVAVGSSAPGDSSNVILESAQAYLDRVPGAGALLSDLIDNVVLQTGCDAASVRAVVIRNFESNGVLVWRSTGNWGGILGTVSRMRSVLRNLGYSDLRDDYPLTAVPSRADRAVLLAFDGADPAVLCYPVAPGEVGNPMIREAAMFQAGAVAPGVTSRYVWVSDGINDFFYDFHARLAIGELPYKRSTEQPTL